MQLLGSRNQGRLDPLYDASGTITTGGTAQLVLPQVPSRSYLFFQNLSTNVMLLELGSARATATLTSGVITSFTITNAGFNFTRPPIIRFAGGGKAGNSRYGGLNQPGGEGPNSSLGAGQIAQAAAVLSGGAVGSITILNGGAGYVIAPYVFFQNSDLDPYGCAAPSATVGMLVNAGGGALEWNGTSCPTDSIAVYGGTTGQAFTCKWMT